MKKWKELTLNEKLMIIICGTLLIMILTRVDFIKKEFSEAINNYFPADTTKIVK